ncbi:Wzz/FepE/Etk N-terminal domain-containing protein [Paenibacillus sp. MZ04-78.2]|uniref:YveK family protein n=1 Tax=Paenibacillus sp. MZ04-78.2 TaxID=2962034 RepID=UPI0020B8861F|nr:Wzz/FepE/Etk N-terminal domain-containing protein [Paenibacillus sp. MZ04-78.2]MCP3773470.1 Wzz/FepE/Etk N-terminal domain-containing protein [Paenibacillus sp. MZ04-78.2]
MELELKEYFSVIRKRIRMIVVIILISCVVTSLLSFYVIKPVYLANSKLIVNKSTIASEKDYLNPDSVRSNLLLVNTYKEIIKSPAIMDKVLDQNPDLGLTTQQLIKKVQVSSVNETQVISVSIEDGSQARAIRIVNAIADVFKAQIPLIMKVDNVMILNEAKVDENPEPVRPKPLINLIIAFVVSFVVSVGLAFLLENLDDTIKTEQDVDNYLGLPVLVTINKTTKDNFKKHRLDKNMKQVGETEYASTGQ